MPGGLGPLAWALGAFDLLVALGWLGLTAFASRFRASFGASPVGVGLATAPVLVFGLLATAAWLPEVAVLHCAAMTIALLLAAAVMPLRAKAPYLTGCTLLHAVAWAWLSVNCYAG